VCSSQLSQSSFPPPDAAATSHKGISDRLEEALLTANTAATQKPPYEGHPMNLSAESFPKGTQRAKPSDVPDPFSLGCHLLAGPAVPRAAGRARAAACQVPVTQGTDAG